MAGENPGDVMALWQRQQEEPQDVAVASVRRRALTIEATARRRSLVFRLSIVNNVAICAALAWLRPETRPFVAVFFLAVSLAQIEALTRSALGHGAWRRRPDDVARVSARIAGTGTGVRGPRMAVVPAAGRDRRARAIRGHVGDRRTRTARGAAARRQCLGDLRLCVGQVATTRPAAAKPTRRAPQSLELIS